MPNLGRISTSQLFGAARKNLLGNQADFAESSLRMNSGQRYLNNYSKYQGSRDITQVTNKLVNKKQLVESYTTASTEFGLAETALNNIKSLLDTLNVDALQASNDSYSPDELRIIAQQLRDVGENIYQISNTKLGEKYIFGGIQSDKKIIDHISGDLFANAVYKEGFSDLKAREVEGLTSSVSLQELYNNNAASAQFQGNAVVTPLVAAAQINLTINDGTQDLYVGDIDFNVGDTMALIVSNINAAFNAAGGVGSIVQDGGGFLDFDTALVVGSADNAQASIIISNGSTNPNTLDEVGLRQATVFGNSKDLRQTLGDLESAYNSGDNARVRTSLVDLQENIERVISITAELGNLQKNIIDRIDTESFHKENTELEQAEIARIPVAEAAQQLNAAQSVLSYTMQFSSRIMQQSIFNFI